MLSCVFNANSAIVAIKPRTGHCTPMEFSKFLIYLKYRALRFIFPKLQRFIPPLADRLAPNLFFTPPRFPETEEDRLLREEATVEFLTINHKKTAIYSWGSGPPVLLIHGWMGRAGNFSRLIRQLTNEGYRALSFDAPAHGASSGKQSNLLEFMEAARIIASRHGPLSACIGHSLGGVTGYLLTLEGMQARALITIGIPSRAEEIFYTFFVRRLNGTLQGAPYLKEWALKHKKFDFEKTFPLHEHPLPDPAQLFVIHDEEDKDVNVKEAPLLHQGNPGSSLLITKGLGHVKILKDKEILQRCLAFIKSRQ